MVRHGAEGCNFIAQCVCVRLCMCTCAEGVVLGVAWNERCRQLSQCLAIATATGFHTIYTSIEQVYCIGLLLQIFPFFRLWFDTCSIIDCECIPGVWRVCCV